jgi:hypothetical protein
MHNQLPNMILMNSSQMQERRVQRGHSAEGNCGQAFGLHISASRQGMDLLVLHTPLAWTGKEWVDLFPQHLLP